MLQLQHNASLTFFKNKSHRPALSPISTGSRLLAQRSPSSVGSGQWAPSFHPRPAPYHHSNTRLLAQRSPSSVSSGQWAPSFHPRPAPYHHSNTRLLALISAYYLFMQYHNEVLSLYVARGSQYPPIRLKKILYYKTCF